MADAMYLAVQAGTVEKSIKLNDRLVVDVSETGDVLGVELLHASAKQGAELQKYLNEGIPVNIVSSTPVVA